jgi:hypothetical protein
MNLELEIDSPHEPRGKCGFETLSVASALMARRVGGRMRLEKYILIDVIIGDELVLEVVVGEDECEEE